MESKKKGKRPLLTLRISDQHACETFEMSKIDPLQIYEISENLFIGGNLKRRHCCSRLQIFETQSN